ncbi:MAG: cystathionine beta-synthase [Actinobacteria bacterium]|nr:cystathionine beta-synthase [Actinomycetota bacterium]
MIYESVVDLIGDTPLVKLNKIASGIEATVVVKVEYLNPGGSTKDRIAVRMIDAAERSGELKPGGTIIEPTSGNTGVGLAIVAQQRGYKCIFVVPDKVAQDKINVMKAYGAEVVVCPYAVEPDDPKSYYSVSARLSREVKDAWKPDQYSNQENPASHYASTGPEIWRDTDGKVTHFVAGVGTGGTISGVGKYLKEKSGNKVRIIGADPQGSVYSGGAGRPYLVEGVGEDFWPTAYDPTVVDEIMEVTDQAAFDMTRRLAREEGLLVGGSCGLAVVAGLEVARKAKSGDLVVILLPDSGRGYLGKIFNDDWMRKYGFFKGDGEDLIGSVLAKKSKDLPDLIHTHPGEAIVDAIEILREFGVSQIPVVKSEPPLMAGEVVGSVSESGLLEAIFTGKAKLIDPISSVQSPPLPMIGCGETISAGVVALQQSDTLLVLDGGKPIGVITRQDLLGSVKQ